MTASPEVEPGTAISTRKRRFSVVIPATLSFTCTVHSPSYDDADRQVAFAP